MALWAGFEQVGEMEALHPPPPHAPVIDRSLLIDAVPLVRQTHRRGETKNWRAPHPRAAFRPEWILMQEQQTETLR